MDSKWAQVDSNLEMQSLSLKDVSGATSDEESFELYAESFIINVLTTKTDIRGPC